MVFGKMAQTGVIAVSGQKKSIIIIAVVFVFVAAGVFLLISHNNAAGERTVEQVLSCRLDEMDAVSIQIGVYKQQFDDPEELRRFVELVREMRLKPGEDPERTGGGILVSFLKDGKEEAIFNVVGDCLLVNPDQRGTAYYQIAPESFNAAWWNALNERPGKQRRGLFEEKH